VPPVFRGAAVLIEWRNFAQAKKACIALYLIVFCRASGRLKLGLKASDVRALKAKGLI
jgi:hypothetical protein